MNILHLNAVPNGGAARAAIRLHDGLRAKGVASQFAVSPGKGTRVYQQPLPPLSDPKWLHPFVRRWRQRRASQRYSQFRPYTFHSDCRTRLRPAHLQRLLPADIINLHWIAHFIDWETCLPWLAQQAPLVWTLHDMNPFSGIWHYEPGADENTPAMRAWNDEVFEIKRRALAHIPDDLLTVVGPSKWIANKSRDSKLLGRFRTEVIPNGLDTKVFHPIEKQVARKALGIRNEIPVVGFLAPNMNDPRKGYRELIQAIDLLEKSRTDLLLLTAGPGRSVDKESSIHLGQIDSDELLRLFYSAADCFVCPSLQESFGQVVTESMACGTPVVAFDTGGIPDMVRPGTTGWLVPVGDSEALAGAIIEALDDRDNLKTLGQTCCKVAETEYSSETQAQKYLEQYKEIACLSN